MVTAILFRFKNLPVIHAQQISIPNCRTPITLLIIICHSASAPHQCFCFYNIKSKSASYFWLFSREKSARWRKTKLGGTYYTCSKLMISPLSEGWFIYHCFHGTAVSLKMDSYKIQMQRKSLKVSCVHDIDFCHEGLIIFFLFSSQQRMCSVVAKFLEDLLRYLIGTFNSQRILS